jgi:hypothetical protein
MRMPDQARGLGPIQAQLQADDHIVLEASDLSTEGEAPLLKDIVGGLELKGINLELFS